MMSLIEKINGWHPVFLSMGALGFSLTDAEASIRVGVLLIAGGYSIWKWWYEWNKSRKK